MNKLLFWTLVAATGAAAASAGVNTVTNDCRDAKEELSIAASLGMADEPMRALKAEAEQACRPAQVARHMVLTVVGS